VVGVNDEKRKKVEVAMQAIQKQYGKENIRFMNGQWEKFDGISTQSIGIDWAMGNGCPRGRIIELYGEQSSGKSSLSLHIIAEAQKQGLAAYIDAEHAFDPEYAKRIGVDTDNLIISQPDYGEQALNIAEGLIRSGGIDCVVIDSVAALVPKAELEGTMEDNSVALQARMMSQAMRKLTGVTNKSHTCVIFINQTRSSIFSTTTPGGKALKFYASVRLEMKQKEKIKDSSGEVIAIKALVNCVKNKVSQPFRKVEIEIEFGKGISRVGELVDYGAELGIIKKAGAWYSYGEERLGQGRENVKKLLTENQELSQEIERKIRELLFDVK